MLRKLYRRFGRWLEVPGETETDRFRKKTYLYLNLVVVVLGSAAIAQGVDLGEPASAVARLSAYCTAVLTSGMILIFRRCPYWMMVFVIVGYSVTIITSDLDAATRATDRWWPLFVLILDLLLVSRARRLAIAVVYLVVLWLVAITAEQAWRFGLFDLPGLLPYSRRIEAIEEEYVCDKPPCALGLKTANTLTTQLAIFILDFILTRYFCDQMVSERARMETAVHAANDIASALAAFDLPRAQESLNAASSRNMPIQLTEALEKLLENLSTYRPYLPDAIFNDGELGGPQTLTQTPPGLRTDGADGDGVATILFTDIVSSTAIWNASPVHMKRALQLHNSLIRKALAEYGGYEVKTIGDSFMAAFSTATDAVISRLLPISVPVPVDEEEEDEFERTFLERSLSHRPVAAPSGWTLEGIPNATFASVTLEMFDHNAAVGSFQRAADQTLQTTVQAINKTDGTLMTLLGNAVFISWNASRRVTAHIQNSFHFARLVHRSVSSRLRTHISSGKVYAGSVGTEGQKFFTVFGGCVGLARALAVSPVNVGAIFCPHSPGYIEGRQRANLRPIGWCRLPVHYDDATDYIVYQVSSQDDESDEGASDWGWSPEYWRLFIARDFVAIRRKFQECDDATLQHALPLLQAAESDESKAAAAKKLAEARLRAEGTELALPREKTLTHSTRTDGST
ncbi:Receptor-type adenylate cyclase A [Diplonema papillatum]|nr:Receptor-type adenylate cyclase A [Diplonema papillatum]